VSTFDCQHGSCRRIAVKVSRVAARQSILDRLEPWAPILTIGMWPVAILAWGASILAMGARLSQLFPSELIGWSLSWSAHFCALVITVPMSLHSSASKRAALTTMAIFTVASLCASFWHIYSGYDIWIIGVAFESYIGAVGVLALAGLSHVWYWRRGKRRMQTGVSRN
jgi:hypothetical protein